MDLSTLRGRARRALGSVRRRTGRFAPSTIESLEGRQLLAAGNFGLNVEISPYASFVNLLQTPGSWSSTSSSTTLAFNASGDPTSDASVTFDLRVNQPWNGPDPNAVAPNLSGTYHLNFNGEATITPQYPGFSTPFAVQNQVYNASTNTTTADLVVPTSNYSAFFGISLTSTQATATSPVDSGFSNAKLIRPGYAANSTQLYTNEFIAALKPYTTLRYLDPENTNNQPFFNGNTLVTVGASAVDQTGAPWEYLIALANQTQTDMWINVPQGATNDYISALAEIFKNGGTVGGVSYAGLNSNLKVYLEYSNEVWGGIPNNLYYQEAAVENNATNQPLSTFSGNLDVYTNADGSTSTNVYTAVGRRDLEETAAIGQIFQSVLGSDPTHQRIRPVLGWQEDNFSFYPGALDWYEHFFGSASSAFYGMGDANYVSSADDSSVANIESSLKSQEAAYSIPDTTDFSVLATYYGLANVSYEGDPGPDYDGTTAGGQVALAASRDPGMEQIVLQHYQDFYAAGGTLALYYDGPFATWSPAGEFGVAELSQIADPAAAAKYRGNVDIANAAPVAVTAGIAVSATGMTNFNATTDSLGSSFSQPVSGQENYWLLNVASAGTDDLKLTTAASGNTVPGQIQVFVNDKEIGGTINVSSLSVIDLGNLPLTAGLDTISIKVVHGASDPSGMNAVFKPSSFTLMKPGMVLVGDSGFESEAVGAGNLQYNPTGSLWTYFGSVGNGSGVSGNNSAMSSGNPSAPEGSEVSFIQGVSTLTQSVSNWAAGTFAISFDAAKRANFGGAEDFEVIVDGNVVGTYQPTSTSYQSYSTNAFTVTAGTHVIELLGLNSLGGNDTSFLDAVSVATATAGAGGSGMSGGSGSGGGSGTVPTIGDFGFETVSVGAGSFAYTPTGSAWAFAGSAGVSGNNSGLTAGAPAAPQGSQVSFLQKGGSMTQAVAGWAAGTYTLSFQSTQRANDGIQAEDFEVMVDGVAVGTFKPSGKTYQAFTTSSFTLSAGSHLIEFMGLDSVGGDNTALIDNVTVALAGSGTGTGGSGGSGGSGLTGSAPTVGDFGFETISVGTGSFAYTPTGSAWTFAGSAGVSASNSGFTAGAPAAPQGSQVGFLQMGGSMTQAVAGWAAGTYTLSFQATQRANDGIQAEDFEVLVDGLVVGTFTPTTNAYQSFTTATFTLSAGSHSIEFMGLDSVGGDNTAFIDNVTAAASAVSGGSGSGGGSGTGTTVGDSGFETVSVGTGNFAYTPTGSAWTFAGSAGVSANSSGFTAGAPAAPQGSQVGFVQITGSITQSVAGWTAGSHTLSFAATQRANDGVQAEDFAILVDGVVVGTFKPTSKTYQSYTTSSFTVTAGAHLIKFQGLDSVGGDNTAFIDNVTIA